VDDRDANLVAIEVNLPNSAFSLLPTVADAARMPLFLPKMVFHLSSTTGCIRRLAATQSD